MNTRIVTGLKAVQIVAGRPDPTAPMSVGAIASQLGATLSSASRLCSELETVGFLERGETYGSYRIGRAAIRLSGRAAAPLTHTLRLALTLAAQQTGETVCLAARSEGGIRIIASVESLWTLHSPAEIGEVVSNEASAIRSVFDGDGVDPGQDGPRYIESTIGMSVEVAAPIVSPSGERVAVVAVRLPANRSGQNLARARRAVVVARRSIESALEDSLVAPRPAAQRAAAPLAVESSATTPSALEAAFRVLSHLAAGRDSIAATARAIGLRADRTQRIIDACQEAGFVWAGAGRGEFQLGWIVSGWHRAAAAPTIVERGAPLVAAMANRTLTCSFITVLKGMRSFTLVEELELAGEGLQMLRWLGRAHPIIGSDGGPTMLMDFTAEEVTALFPTRHTQRELDVFLKRMRHVVRHGVLSMQAFEEGGLVSISAPVRDSSGAVAAAACIVGTTDYMRQNAEEFERAAVQLAAEVTELLA